MLTPYVEAADMATTLTAFSVDVGGGRAAVVVDRITTVHSGWLKEKVGDLPEARLADVRGMLAAIFGFAS